MSMFEVMKVLLPPWQNSPLHTHTKTRVQVQRSWGRGDDEGSQQEGPGFLRLSNNWVLKLCIAKCANRLFVGLGWLCSAN